jgi:hypothetical protein
MNRSWRAGAENTRPWFKARLHPRPGGGFLDRIDRAFDWPAFEACWPRPTRRSEARASYPCCDAAVIRHCAQPSEAAF